MRLAVVGLLILSNTAFAQSRGSLRPSPLEMGRTQYERGRYARALELFGEAVNQSDSASSRNLAYYYQGLALFELGLYYSSYTSFRNVLLTADNNNRQVYEKAIKNAVIITDKLDMPERIGKALDALPGTFISSAVSAHSHYAIGAHYFSAGDDSRAASHLKSVNPESPFYARATFLLGIIATRAKNYSEASAQFERSYQACGKDKEKAGLKELARLNLARTAYSAGQVERSIELYAQFTSKSPHWLTILLEASWPLLRVNDTTVSLGNLHTVLSPFYQEDLVGEGYVLRATILFSLCKYEEMKKTLAQFFAIYDPILRSMQSESNRFGGDRAFFESFSAGKGINHAFYNFAKRDQGIAKAMKVHDVLKRERRELARLGRNETILRLAKLVDEAIASTENDIGRDLRKLHARKLKELVAQREQANYLKVEIVTGEKELIEGQKGLPPRRVVDVETSVGENYHFWPYVGEYWEDELGAYVYTTESSCVN
jgi:tetratricopeptide (TPR) repeat protein